MLTYFIDSHCDFNLEDAARVGAKMISMPYIIDGKTIYPYEDWKTYDYKAFYNSLRSGTMPTTCAVPENKYYEYFEPEFAAGNDIFYLHFSEAMTMSFQTMRKVIADLQGKYPERKFYEFDTRSVTVLDYIMNRDFFVHVKEGYTPEQLLEWCNAEVQHYAQYFFADDLKFFRRGGRVSGLAATMGGLIGVRPIIYMSPEGKMESIGTEKGRGKAIARLLREVDEKGLDVKKYGVVIGHTDAAQELLDAVISGLRSKFGDDLDITVVPTNPTAGAHCGPNGVGVAFHSKCR